MDWTEIAVQFISIMVSGLTEMAEGIGTGVQEFVTRLFFVTGEGGAQSLSVFAVVIAIFAAVGTAVGVGRLILSWLGSIGGSRL